MNPLGEGMINQQTSVLNNDLGHTGFIISATDSDTIILPTTESSKNNI